MSALAPQLGGPHRRSEPLLGQIPEDNEMNDHMKAMWAGQSNVLVAVRARPLMKHDVVKKSCVRVLDSKVVVILDPAAGDKQDVLRANRNREKQYAFDHVFDPGCTQEHVYNSTAKFLLHGVLDGYNATVFAYGQTGSGKTHTMIGSEADPGIMVRVMEDLFNYSRSQGSQNGVHYKVTVSFLEVYNENIRDLLSDVEEYLDLREDPIKGPVVASITEIETTSGQEIMGLLHQGNAKRSQAATAANEVSSRSHAVLQVVVECRDRAPGTVANIKVGKLSLVDLAGSERAANTKNVGQRLVEGANINRSLLALGNCINALGEKGNKGNFVPYRDSKLTRLLKDSLGGNCRTVMIANISSAESSFEETLNTLKYANRAKNIKTNIQRNVLNVNYHISEYVELINNLRSEIQVLKGQISAGGINHPLERIGSARSSQGNRPADHGFALNNNNANGIAINTNFSNNGSQVNSHNGIPGRALSPLGNVNGPGNFAPSSPLHSNRPHGPNPHEPSTPFQALRESLKSATANNENRELIYNMRQRIVDNFQERMQLRRSLIELEDQNVQNSIEVSKRQLLVVQWSEHHGDILKDGDTTKADFTAYIVSNGSSEVIEAWQECEQLRKAIIKNNGMKKNIAKRLRYNEREAEKFREDLSRNVTSEDRKELMALQYQVGRLELENMELEQHRIVHESILKGKDLTIQKLKLQLAVRDKIITRQQMVLKEHNLDNKVGYEQLALMEETLMAMNDSENMAPPSPPRAMTDILSDFGTGEKLGTNYEMSDEFISTPEEGQQRKRGGGEPTSSQRKRSQKHHNNRHNHRGKRDGNSMDNGDHNSKPQVPRLKISNNNNNEKSFSDEENPPVVVLEDNENDYEEVIPLTERGEIALTSRDRDFIEQGDWSEIQSELSDQSFSFGREQRGGGADRKQRPHNPSNRRESKESAGPQSENKNNNLIKPEVQSKLSSIKEPKGVHGPRGGRVYRSSLGNSNSNTNSTEITVTNSSSNNIMKNDGNLIKKMSSNNPSHQNRDNNPGHSNNNNNEDGSDDDSINQKFHSKYRHYNSPRPNEKNSNKLNVVSFDKYDKLEPIVKESNQNEEGGIFSGRKIDRDVSNSKDVSPRGNDNNNYAVIYPTAASASSSAAAVAAGGPPPPHHHKKERLLTDLSAMTAEEKYAGPSGRGGGGKERERASRKASADEDNSDYFEIKEAKDVNSGVDNGLVIKSKPIGSKPVLGKIKSRAQNVSGNNLNAGNMDGNLSSLPSAASLDTGVSNAIQREMNNNNPPPVGPQLELGILGSGFEGMNNNIGNRPSNRLNKPVIR
jgi:hypothetical protein